MTNANVAAAHNCPQLHPTRNLELRKRVAEVKERLLIYRFGCAEMAA
jgi:hypothetical protein